MVWTIVSLSLSLLGIGLACTSILLTHITFFNPSFWLRFILLRPAAWEKIDLQDSVVDFWRHRNLSGFTISVDFDAPVSDKFHEQWMEAVFYADPRARSYYAVIQLNGVPLRNMLFLSYDGGRNFVPVPNVELRGGRYYYHFDKMQRLLFKVIGNLYIKEDFDDYLDSIINSRFNPIVSPSDIKNAITIKELGKRIEAFKNRCC